MASHGTGKAEQPDETMELINTKVVSKGGSSEVVTSSEGDTLVQASAPKGNEQETTTKPSSSEGLTLDQKKKFILAQFSLVIAILLLSLGLVTEKWGKIGSKSGQCNCSGAEDAAIALESLGLSAAIQCAAFAAVYIFLALVDCATGKSQYFPLTAMIMAIVGGVSTIIGCAVYGGEHYGQVDPSYSFFLALLGAGALIAGGVLTYWAKRCGGATVDPSPKSVNL